MVADLADKKKCELISLENRNRKKFVAKTGESIACASKLGGNIIDGILDSIISTLV
jgi:hypothetical protein